MTSNLPSTEAGYLRAELLDIWKSLLDSTTLSVDDDFFEKGGDSLLATEMVLEVERRLCISVPESLLFEASTIRKLAEIFSRPSEVEHKVVFPVGDTPGHGQLLFFHGDWTNGGFYLKGFARSIGPDLPVVAVAPHGTGGERMPPSLKDMAAERLPQILEFQPRGPFRLGGHCVGGIVALETARLLVSGGHDVEFVAMIDPMWTGAGWPFPLLERRRNKRDVHGNPTWALPEMKPTAESAQKYLDALAVYVPEPLPVPVPVIVFSSKFDGKPWHKVNSDFTLFELPGGHFDLVTARADVFGAHLRKHLNERAMVAASSTRITRPRWRSKPLLRWLRQ